MKKKMEQWNERLEQNTGIEIMEQANREEGVEEWGLIKKKKKLYLDPADKFSLFPVQCLFTAMDLCS